MGLWSRLWGDEKALNTSVEAVRDGLDKMWYTREEETQDTIAAKQRATELMVEWLKATTGQNLARRLLALTITLVWLLQYLAALVFDLVAIWALDPKPWLAASKVTGDRANAMDGAMMLILGFYFAAPYADRISQYALERFGRMKEKKELINDAK